MDFCEIAEASVAFGGSTKYACNVSITTLEAMQPLATLPFVVFLRGDQSFVAMLFQEIHVKYNGAKRTPKATC